MKTLVYRLSLSLKMICFAIFLLFLSMQLSLYTTQLSFLYALLPNTHAYADEVKEIQQEIDKLQEMKSMSENATRPLESQVKNLDVKIRSTHYSIIQKSMESQKLEGDISQSQEALVVQYALLNKLVADQYRSYRLMSPVLVLINAPSASDLLYGLVHNQIISDYMTAQVGALAQRIELLALQKQSAQELAQKLTTQKTQLSGEAGVLKTEITKAKEFQTQLKGQIASLTAKQQAIISARSGGGSNTNASGVPTSGDFNATLEGFLTNAPSGSFAVFSFGAYTHRRGMSQYGANARAQAGQDYSTILNAYYGKNPVDRDIPSHISVAGFGNLDFENYYLMGIAEMPSSWHIEALKAQAVAARTYAYRYLQSGRTICITEACQVFSNSKAANPPEAWRRAVEETRGKILEDVVTYYSAASGGYLTPLGWDTTDGSGAGDWTKNAWEVKANSPWFYKAWYRVGYSDSGADCGRRAWLSEEEMADILNAFLLRQNPNGADVSRILPVTINNCKIGGQSGDPYSMQELKNLLDNPVTSISGKPTLQHSDTANTTSVSFQTNRGTISMSGSEFKEIFNARAPGYLRIPQSRFAFFNIERKI